MEVSKLVLSNLIKNKEYMQKVIPFLDHELFMENEQKLIFNITKNYVEKYNSCPSFEAINISLEKLKINDMIFQQTKSLLKELNEYSSNQSIDYLFDETQTWAKEIKLDNALGKAVDISIGNDEKLDKNAIPDILSKALAYSFDDSIGHSYFGDAEKQYEYYHHSESRLPFDIDILNHNTSGGVPNKTISVFMAGINCFVGSQEIDVYVPDDQLDLLNDLISIYS